MTETEFDIMDELYFVQHFSYLKETLNWEDDRILDGLKSLHVQGWIKCLKTPDEEIFSGIDIQNVGKTYFYLATKKGLMAHNTI